MADIILKDRDGIDGEYLGVKAVKFNTTDGGTKTFIEGETGTTTVAPDFSEGDMVVTPEDGILLTEVTIQKPENLLPENILKDVDIAGVVGTHECQTGESSGGYLPRKAINFYDIYGNVVYSYTRAEAKLLTELPPVPEIEGFTTYGWSTTNNKSVLSEVQNEVAFRDVVPRYKKDDKVVDIFVVEVQDNTTITLNFYYLSYMQFDWGDGGGWVQGTGSGQGTISHTYSKAGRYIIAFYSSSASNCYVGYSSGSNNVMGVAWNGDYSLGINGCLVSALVCSNIKIGKYAFCNLPKLKFVAHKNTGQYSFYNCYSLETLVSLSSLSSNYALMYCYSLKRYTALTTQANQFVTLTGLTDFKYMSTNTLYSLPKTGNLRYIFTGTTAPTLSASFPSTYNGYTIYVPDDCVEAYKTKWSEQANYIKPLSEYPDY